MPVFQVNKAPKTRWHKQAKSHLSRFDRYSKLILSQQTMPVVSEDPYVRRLTQSAEQDVEIVMSSGYAIGLVNHQRYAYFESTPFRSVSALLMMYCESWEIPVSIVQDESTGNQLTFSETDWI